MTQRVQAWVDRFPEPGQTTRQRLEHTLAVYQDSADDDYVLEATRNIYGQGVVTGLTFGDLRHLADGYV